VSIPEQSRLISLGLAAAELAYARARAGRLPFCQQFEDHAGEALVIGAAAARIELLVAFSGRDDMDRSSPAPLEADAAVPNLTAAYATAERWAEDTGLPTHRLRNTLLACRALHRHAEETPSLSTGSLAPRAWTSLRTLIDLGIRCEDASAREPRRVRRAPDRKTYDPRWELARPGEPLKRMERIESEQGLLQKLHHTAFREPVAIEVAALNLFEYDGLPWRFYVDMLTQMEDEARHSLMCLDALLRRGGDYGSFRLPYLGNYYEMFWEMDLSERLVTMNIDTEGQGQGYLAEIASRLREAGEPACGELFECLADDEHRHARFGGRWLRYLYPDPHARGEVISRIRSFRAVNLASAHAAVEEATVLDAIETWTSRRRVLDFLDDESESLHELEVSLGATRSQRLQRSDGDI
jgi:uncharacterized ferritin-like protein (DUF455 family)